MLPRPSTHTLPATDGNSAKGNLEQYFMPAAEGTSETFGNQQGMPAFCKFAPGASKGKACRDVWVESKRHDRECGNQCCTNESMGSIC